MTTQLISRYIDEYAEKYSTNESPALAALNRETNLKRGDAVMLSGHLQGAFLQMISKMVRPSSILEIGTYTGYSAMCLAQGLQPGGSMHTIEMNEELEDIAAAGFKNAGLEDTITQHIGIAIDVLSSLPGPFDLVFVDADKANYGLYYDMVFDKVPVGGYIIADNVLYGGEVILPKEEQSRNALAIHQFNEKIKADGRIEHLLVPVRDGLMVMRKVRDN